LTFLLPIFRILSSLVGWEDAGSAVIDCRTRLSAIMRFGGWKFLMAHLWIQSTSGWGAQKLDAAQFDLAAIQAPQAGDARLGTASAAVTQLIRSDASGSQVWAVVASRDSDIRVNGRAVLAGLCVLADRDEIRTNGKKYFYSTEALATVQAFPGADRPVFCGRCRQQIGGGAPAVCCPGCGIWYNESIDFPCWTYADKCTFCGHPTPLDSGFSWTPEED
jgi:hypothetical protein